MRIIIGSDHRGYELKEYIKNHFQEDYEIVDVGCFSEESVDYPDISKSLAHEMKKDLEENLGILICSTGIGMSIAVNKFPHIRGALLYNYHVAKTSKEHNNANVLCLGSDQHSLSDSLNLIKIFLQAKFSYGRHEDRINKILDLDLD